MGFKGTAAPEDGADVDPAPVQGAQEPPAAPVHGPGQAAQEPPRVYKESRNLRGF